MSKYNEHVRNLVVAMFRDDNLSYLQIAVILSRRGIELSRNAAAGHINRARALGVDIPSKRIAIAERALVKRMIRRRSPMKTSTVVPEPEPEPEPVEAAPEPYEGPVGALAILGHRSGHTCSWPIGDPKEANFRFCCEPCFGTYCLKHAKLAYVPRGQAKKRDPRVHNLIPEFR